MYKAAPATLGDYRTIMRLSQFGERARVSLDTSSLGFV
jgi:hypothetical protein